MHRIETAFAARRLPSRGHNPAAAAGWDAGGAPSGAIEEAVPRRRPRPWEAASPEPARRNCAPPRKTPRATMAPSLSPRYCRERIFSAQTHTHPMFPKMSLNHRSNPQKCVSPARAPRRPALFPSMVKHENRNRARKSYAMRVRAEACSHSKCSCYLEIELMALRVLNQQVFRTKTPGRVRTCGTKRVMKMCPRPEARRSRRCRRR